MTGAKDHCGVVAAWGPDAGHVALDVLKGLQHRGRESAGIAGYTAAGRFFKEVGMGTLDKAIDIAMIPHSAQVAIGHSRYSTAAESSIEHAQPIGGGHNEWVVGHNGDVPNFLGHGVSDSTIVHSVVEDQMRKGHNIVEALHWLMSVADGAYSITGLLKDGTIVAARDPQGFKPLCVGRIGQNIVVASETVGITHTNSAVGWAPRRDAEVLFHVKPGEMAWVDRRGNLSKKTLVEGKRVTTCAFEYAYFARKETEIDGVSVGDFRYRMGELLADKAAKEGVAADIVVPVLGSGEEYAKGYASRSRLPLVKALIKNSDERVFIGPDASKRAAIARTVHNVLNELVRGKRVVVTDDSIVRGDTSTAIVEMLWEAQAKEVHMLVGYWAVRYPCYEGIAFHGAGELIAAERTVDDVREMIKSTTLIFPEEEEYKRVLGRNDLCSACHTGDHPLSESTLRRIHEVGFRTKRQPIRT